MIMSPVTTILGPDDSDDIDDAFCRAKKIAFGDVDDYMENGGSAAMGESLDRGHVMAISLWDDVEVNMLWLDSAFPLDKPATDLGVQRGDCPGGEQSTPEYLRANTPDGWVSFQSAFVGPIGSFLSQPPTPSPVPPSPGNGGGGGGCCQFEADCGDCGLDGIGWCHQSVSNCATCTGFFNYSATTPNCGGSSPSPQPQPTPSPGPCSDWNQNCGTWAASGQCEANPAYMLVNCALSCGACSPPTQAPAPPPCIDANQNCGIWAAGGQCAANPAYMLVNCALSCGVCSRGALTQASTATGGPGLCCFGEEKGNCQGGWCGDSKGNCEGNCNGKFVPSAGLASLKMTKKHV